MRKYVIMGVQGSGKGTQSQLLAADLDLVHISVGDILRWNVQNHTKLGAQVRRVMAAGELVSYDAVESVGRDRVDQHGSDFSFIVDGVPRDAGAVARAENGVGGGGRDGIHQKKGKNILLCGGSPRNRRQAEFFLESYDIDG